MKRVALLVLTGALAFAPVSASLGAVQPWSCNVRSWCGGLDGTWWQHLAISQRPIVVETMIEGASFGYDWGTFDAVSSYLDAYQSPTNTKNTQVFFKRLRDPVNAVTFSKSTQTYVKEIDHFYAAYPQKRPLKVIMVLSCLKDHPLFNCDVVGKSELLPWPTGP